MAKPIRIDVITTDGRTISRERAFAKGAPEEPLLMKDFKALFIKFTRGILPDAKCSWLADAIAEMENLDGRDMTQVLKSLVFDSTV